MERQISSEKVLTGTASSQPLGTPKVTVNPPSTPETETLPHSASSTGYLERLKNSHRISTRYDRRRFDESVDLPTASGELANFIFSDDGHKIAMNSGDHFDYNTDDDKVPRGDGPVESVLRALPSFNEQSSRTGMICIHVDRAWDLPETLADTNPFVVIDWAGIQFISNVCHRWII